MTRVRVAAAITGCCLLATACFGSATEPRTEVSAIFHGTSNLFVGSEVRVLGLPVGTVVDIEPLGDVVRVDMEVSPDHPLPADVTANLKPVSLLGERFVQFDPPYTSGPTLPDGSTIPLERTSEPAEVDDVLRSFENFLQSLDRDVLADLISTLSETLDGNGAGLNELIDQGSTTIRVLADSSGDLNAVVSELAALNEVVATREEKIGNTLDQFSIVLQTLIEERDEIIASVDNLRRLAAELRPLIEDHDDQLVTDLEVLATTLSTVERNLERLGETFLGGRELFAGTGRAIEYEDARLPLDNETARLNESIEARLVDRLVGLCIRLGIEECADPDFFEPLIPNLLCIEGVTCDEGATGVGQAIADVLDDLPPEVGEALREEAASPEQPAPAPSDDSAPAPGGEPSPEPTATEEPLIPELPLPDPRLGDDEDRDEGLLDTLLSYFGGQA